MDTEKLGVALVLGEGVLGQLGLWQLAVGEFLVGGLLFFYIFLILGISSQLTNSYLSEGWFNHQPVKDSVRGKGSTATASPRAARRVSCVAWFMMGWFLWAWELVRVLVIYHDDMSLCRKSSPKSHG